MKRPEGWVKQRTEFFESHQEKNRWGKTRQLDYEAGAEAIIKLYKAQGISYENSMSIPKLSGFIHGRAAGKKGKMVFIEEEE